MPTLHPLNRYVAGLPAVLARFPVGLVIGLIVTKLSVHGFIATLGIGLVISGHILR